MVQSSWTKVLLGVVCTTSAMSWLSLLAAWLVAIAFRKPEVLHEMSSGAFLWTGCVVAACNAALWTWYPRSLSAWLKLATAGMIAGALGWFALAAAVWSPNPVHSFFESLVGGVPYVLLVAMPLGLLVGLLFAGVAFLVARGSQRVGPGWTSVGVAATSAAQIGLASAIPWPG